MPPRRAMPLSAEAEEAFAELFNMIDTNKNGVIERREQEKAKKTLHSMMPPRVRCTWTDFDSDANRQGCIIFDQNRDRKISKTEWHDAMRRIVDKVGEEELLACIIRSWPDHPLVARRCETMRMAVPEFLLGR